MSNEANYKNFSYLFENSNLKKDVHYLGTHPRKDILVQAYEFDISIEVAGQADSVDIVINNKLYRSKLPFYFQTNNLDKYNIVSAPKGRNVGFTYTTVKQYNKVIDRYTHEKYEVGKLNGNL